MSDIPKTFMHFNLEEQRRLGASGDFSLLMSDIATACKVISDQVNHGALIGVLGSAGTENIQGETQKTLDVLSNEVFIQAMELR